MPSIIDRLMALRPRGLPASNVAIPDTSFIGADQLSTYGAPVNRANPYRPHTGNGDTFPTPPTLHPQFIPPNRRPGGMNGLPAQSMGLALGHLLAPGQDVRKGIVHPGRRLGHTGNPNVPVGSQPLALPPTVPRQGATPLQSAPLQPSFARPGGIASGLRPRRRL